MSFAQSAMKKTAFCRIIEKGGKIMKYNNGYNKKRTRCEVWSRVVGYLRPVSQWNEGKQEEFKMRENFNLSTQSGY